MSDEPKPPEDETSATRPNAGYPLTENNNSEGEMVFYYSREHRLAKAPQSVRDLYKETAPAKFNLLRPLISTKPKAVMFISILIITVMSIFTSIWYHAGDGPGGSLGGNTISASALRYEGTTIVVLKKKVQGRDSPYTGTVNIMVSPVLKKGKGSASPVVEPYRISFTQKTEEEYRFALPFEDEEVLFYIQGGDNSLEFKLKTQ
ncbi:hypothetical protein FACS189450_13230 [Spirochaetia bacterium]|nr:hypothetical protein FACS189450_13230 [Spirochaetia bacterium]